MVNTPQTDHDTVGHHFRGEKITIFVYGTLRRGCCFNKHYLGSAEYLGQGATVNKFCMFALDGLPFIDKAPKSRIVGDIYNITAKQLKELDYLENHPKMYRRERVAVEVDGHGAARQVIMAWAYFVNTPYYFKRHVIKSGNFLDYLKAHSLNCIWVGGKVIGEFD